MVDCWSDFRGVAGGLVTSRSGDGGASGDVPPKCNELLVRGTISRVAHFHATAGLAQTADALPSPV
jgi:hypothetical protein